MKRFVLPFALSLVAVACTSTQTHVDAVRQAAEPLRLSGARVVVLPFRSAPGQPETGPSVRDLISRALIEQRHAVVTSPSLVEGYLKEHAVVPSEDDRGPLEVLAAALGAEVVVWGSVNQFTPYRFDRLAPATPPYIELTVRALRVGVPGVAAVTARKQGSLPATIWSRQPTFDDVATEAIRELLPKLP